MKEIFEIRDKKIINSLLDSAEYGTLALSAENRPYAVPVNFVRIGEDICFHGALRNKKMKMLEQNPHVSFSVVDSFSIIDSDFSSSDGLACPATQFFKSVNIEGEAAVLTDRDEKAEVLSALMRKLQSKGGYRPFSDNDYDRVIKATAIVKIGTQKLSCKFKFGQHLSEERFDMILSHLKRRGTEIDLRTASVMKELRAVGLMKIWK